MITGNIERSLNEKLFLVLENLEIIVLLLGFFVTYILVTKLKQFLLIYTKSNDKAPLARSFKYRSSKNNSPSNPSSDDNDWLSRFKRFILNNKKSLLISSIGAIASLKVFFMIISPPDLAVTYSYFMKGDPLMKIHLEHIENLCRDHREALAKTPKKIGVLSEVFIHSDTIRISNRLFQQLLDPENGLTNIDICHFRSKLIIEISRVMDPVTFTNTHYFYLNKTWNPNAKIISWYNYSKLLDLKADLLFQNDRNCDSKELFRALYNYNKEVRNYTNTFDAYLKNVFPLQKSIVKTGSFLGGDFIPRASFLDFMRLNDVPGRIFHFMENPESPVNCVLDPDYKPSSAFWKFSSLSTNGTFESLSEEYYRNLESTGEKKKIMENMSYLNKFHRSILFITFGALVGISVIPWAGLFLN